MHRPDPRRLRLADSPPIGHKPSTQLPRHKPGQKFLRGPIPWIWVQQAAKLPGKALHVAVALWFLAGLKNRRDVPLSMTRLAAMGVSRWAAYRGLKALEGANLVEVSRHRGRNPIVSLSDIPTS